jgi:hypothetical protein
VTDHTARDKYVSEQQIHHTGGIAMHFRVDSEVGQLREAIIHRPGLELSRLTPDNIGALLFDDVMWASKAKEEHDAFAEALRDKGVLVHYHGQLLAETLVLAEGGSFVAHVEIDFGSGIAAAQPIGDTTPAALRTHSFPDCSMGPKVEAACRFVEATGSWP